MKRMRWVEKKKERNKGEGSRILCNGSSLFGMRFNG